MCSAAFSPGFLLTLSCSFSFTGQGRLYWKKKKKVGLIFFKTNSRASRNNVLQAEYFLSEGNRSLCLCCSRRHNVLSRGGTKHAEYITYTAPRKALLLCMFRGNDRESVVKAGFRSYMLAVLLRGGIQNWSRPPKNCAHSSTLC